MYNERKRKLKVYSTRTCSRLHVRLRCGTDMGGNKSQVFKKTILRSL